MHLFLMKNKPYPLQEAQRAMDWITDYLKELWFNEESEEEFEWDIQDKNEFTMKIAEEYDEEETSADTQKIYS